MDAGDRIGTESYFDIKSDLEVSLLSHAGSHRLPPRRQKKKGKEFPPPLTCISLNENMKRYYTADGRLVIREEKSNYLRARRSNGRLTLELVSSNDDVVPDRKANVEAECEPPVCEPPVNDAVLDCEIKGVDEVTSKNVVDRTGMIGGAKCYKWGAFDIGARAIRPVLI